MSLITLILFATTLIFGIIAIILSVRQESLHQERDKMAEMMKALTDGLILLSNKGKVVAMNDEARGLLHIHSEHPVLADITNSFLGNYDIAGKITQAMQQNMRTEDKEIRLGDRIVNIVITPLYGIKGFDVSQKVTIKGVSIVLQDNTSKRNEEKNRDDMTNMMVHELRAPLTAIKDASGLMLESDSLEKEERGKLLWIIREQAMVLLDTVTTMLDSAKLRDGRFTIQKLPSDIKKIIRDQMSLFAQQAKNKNITFIQDVSEDIPFLSFDPMRIAQVLNNLLSNSIKFTPDGGMIIVRSFIKYSDMGPSLGHTPWLILEVRDTGVGVPPNQLQHLFTKFYQTTTVDTSHKSPGSGLGLFVVKGIIEAHGGTISCQSEQNRGTTMTFSIPAIIEHRSSLSSELHQSIIKHQQIPHETTLTQRPLTIEGGNVNQPTKKILN
jgi:two-component system, OmpR family, sensor histidine kinase VicK